MEKISKIIIEMNGEKNEFSGGGSVGPDSVGHDELKDDSVDTNNIVDGSVQMQDLNDGVKKNMTHSYDAENEGIRLGGIVGGQEAGHAAAADDGSDDV